LQSIDGEHRHGASAELALLGLSGLLWLLGLLLRCRERQNEGDGGDDCEVPKCCQWDPLPRSATR
jgi:hypothetical protein